MRQHVDREPLDAITLEIANTWLTLPSAGVTCEARFAVARFDPFPVGLFDFVIDHSSPRGGPTQATI
jgi:hypothetical protein